MSAGVAARVAAVRILDAVVQRGRSLKAEFANALPALPDPRDRALTEAIVFSALRNRARYDEALVAWMPKPPGRRDGELRALLWAGFAQLDALGLPPHAAVDATVASARELGREHQAGLVNALLRRALREPLPAADAGAAWPEWLANRIRNDWPGDAEAIFDESAKEAPSWLRVNRRRGSRDDYLRRLREAGINASVDERLADAVKLESAVPVAQLPGFDAGDASVQDGSAQAVADALSPPLGARVLDACAAPGGKAAHLAERDPSLRIVALDVDARRVRRMQETFARLGIEIESRAADAADPAAWWDGTAFDAILLDAPCSATGIVRRQPDVLLHRRESDLASLVALQAKLLDALWPALAPGGALLYATCSILSEENSGQVRAFLEGHADAALEPLDARFGRDTGFGSQRLPGEGGMDGFFCARLRKR
ncbi:16S rRNA (cytosine(967)-C(5))-methyltransferase RsmB [Pseudoluteimonas lycopersici]|uniref:16S rRNA (cytosine(967)-C(5))-methyltransferase n=1 Tax=Pseudoluteimonas lycopersici TaxID=1324796 RepID=A0A516V6W6_9GAMM|nr:16S rRNA (cytosine(967)-C(5))-methyltransferase RsmB [Lysobacter lycopersici]QDQ74253.1 16S rRNA (cytosine(967)-C(5))-methyltransferase RsmB [Lysobacter lycopersici]